MARYIDPGRIPGPVFIPGVVAVRLFWTLPNQKRAYNVLHASYGTAPTIDVTWINSLGDSIKAALGSTGLAGALDVATKLDQVGVRNMAEQSPGVGFAEWVSATASVAGTAVGGQPLPPGTAFVISLKTGLSRQANRGRVYLPGYNSGALQPAGTIGNTPRDDSVEFVQAVQAALGTRNLTLCIAQPARQAYTGVTGVNYAARQATKVSVTSIVALNNRFDSQRLRGQL